jgi:ABC-type transport system involved in cytochrome bd biosynthesis fused ATPase/permease subunit
MTVILLPIKYILMISHHGYKIQQIDGIFMRQNGGVKDAPTAVNRCFAA